ncbi:MAG TPA: vWA domain-containing protein [Polyangiaceae bacterium]|nr:vWA domain-containing protein [Polyangiaceae bacterium]
MPTRIPCVLTAVALLACSAPEDGSRRPPAKATGGTPASSPTGVDTTGGAGGSAALPTLFVDAAIPTKSADGGTSCQRTASAETELEPVHLAFAFDVSGSMGKLDFPYHDPKLKWDPVVAAAKAFFTDTASANLFASLVFFPIDAGEDERCDAKSYATPDVPMTALPSDAFGAAIDDVTPKKSSDWRGGTPTLAVLQATYQFIEPLAKADGSSKYAMVLVSDGYPEGCSDDDNEIETVVAAVKKASADIPTYVIGVANPPGGPDTVTNLNDLAIAGGTDRAFIVQTGDPAATITAFQTAVHTIRDSQLSCDFVIPPPPSGQMFDPARANVTYTSGSTERELDYDAACGADGAWKFDDPSSPTHMVLCDATCTRVRADPHAVLRVDFGCARRDVLR